MAHHAVLNVAKLQEVLPELVVADLALRNPGNLSALPAGKAAVTRPRHRSLTVPPTNIFRVRALLLPEFFGTAALASTFLLSIKCSRCCSPGHSGFQHRQQPRHGRWQALLQEQASLAPPRTAARAAGPHTSQSQSPAPPSARSRSPLPCAPGARKRAATAAHPSAQTARDAYHCRQYSSSVSLVVLLSRPPRNSLPSTNSWSMRGRGPPDAPCGRATPP